MHHNGMFADLNQSMLRPAALKRKDPMPNQACSDKPIILFMDSLHADSVDEMINHLREYLELEYIEKKVDPADKKYFLESSYNWKPFNESRVP